MESVIIWIQSGDGYLDVDELAVGTIPLDATSKPANRLPECAVYYNEIDGINLIRWRGGYSCIVWSNSEYS